MNEMREKKGINNKVRDAIWKRDKNTCQRCGGKLDRSSMHTTPLGGTVHHKNRDCWNDNLDTLILLCGKCHTEIHRIATRVENVRLGRKSSMPTQEEIKDMLKYINLEYKEI
jgi:5-methylcytosine-specific restriction endonuclease McrA